jgi:pimeloyl-ACP methyl ester carboxylesterase
LRHLVAGYSTHLAIGVLGIWAADPWLDKLAARVITDMELGALAGCASLAFVAHSMGGLVTQRALLNAPDLARHTSHVLLCGTPSGGLKKAAVGWLLRC